MMSGRPAIVVDEWDQGAKRVSQVPHRPSATSASLKAWNASYLRQLPSDIRDDLLSDAFVVTIPAGSPIYAAYRAARFVLIHTGRARVQAQSLDGRSATIRYAGPGQVIGLPSTLANQSPVGAEAVSDCEVSFLNVSKVQRLIRTRPEVGELLLREVTSILFEVIELFTENLFGSVLQRVSRHLIDLAEETPEGLIVHSDQNSIAEAIGSVREVVARALRTLREEKVVVRKGNGILILDRDRLHEYSHGEG